MRGAGQRQKKDEQANEAEETCSKETIKEKLP